LSPVNYFFHVDASDDVVINSVRFGIIANMDLAVGIYAIALFIAEILYFPHGKRLFPFPGIR